jgi:hypothetical protein
MNLWRSAAEFTSKAVIIIVGVVAAAEITAST